MSSKNTLPWPESARFSRHFSPVWRGEDVCGARTLDGWNPVAAQWRAVGEAEAGKIIPFEKISGPEHVVENQRRGMRSAFQAVRHGGGQTKAKEIFVSVGHPKPGPRIAGVVREQSPGQHGRRRRRDLMVDLRESPGDKRRSEARSKILGGAGPVHRTNSGNVRKVGGARSAVMNQVRLDHIVWAGTVPGESRRVMLPRSVRLVADVRHHANRDPEDAVGRRFAMESVHSVLVGEVKD